MILEGPLERGAALLHKVCDALPRQNALTSKLRDALSRCEKQYGISADEAFQRLTDIQIESFLPLPRVETEKLLEPDAKATLLRADQKLFKVDHRPEEITEARWRDLTKVEKRAANNLASFLGSGRSFLRQRPAQIDYRVALYLLFTLEELLSRKLPFSRPPSGGAPHGPAFEALLAAVALAQLRISVRREGPLDTDPKPAALGSLIEVTRSIAFDELLRIQGLDRSPSNAAGASHVLSQTIGMARSWQQKKRGTD